MKICLDPGHYGDDYNPGVAAGYVESNFTWAYYFLLKERLEKLGVEVIVTRDAKNEYPKKSNGKEDLQARGKKAKGCDLFISIHSNAVDNKPQINSVFCHWSVRSGGEGIAKKIGNALTVLFRDEWGQCDAPTFYAQESTKYPGFDYFGVLKGASSVDVPGVIIEHSFHTNVTYCEWAMVPGNLEKMADVEVKAIAEYYNLGEPMPDDIFCIPLEIDLVKGDKGEAVKRLQMRMRQISPEYDAEVKAHSFKNGVPDGSFGGGMEKTLRKFQAQAGLPQTGWLDPETREVLNENVANYYYDLCGANATISAVRNIVS